MSGKPPQSGGFAVRLLAGSIRVYVGAAKAARKVLGLDKRAKPPIDPPPSEPPPPKR